METRDCNMQQKQEQEEHQQYDEQTKLELNAMSDEEFFKLIGNLEHEIAEHL